MLSTRIGGHRWRRDARRTLFGGAMLATHGLPPPARWLTLWRALRARGDDDLYHQLVACYEEPARHYHTTTHLEEMFSLWPAVERLARHPAEVELAIWFHDAIYVPLRNDNEVLSAEWASSSLIAAGAHDEVAARVSGLILATRHDAEPSAGDQQVLVDLDLAILGASPQRFDEYERQVRAEFAMVPVPLFRTTRRGILETFLARPVIYHAAPIHDARERQARENLARSVARLSLACLTTAAVACGPATGSSTPGPAAVEVVSLSSAAQASGTQALLIAVSPVNDQVAWAAGTQGTWLRTTDGGTTWVAGRVPEADSLQFRDVHGVDASTALLLSIGNGAQSRVYRTTDGGARWTVQQVNPDSAGFYDCMDFWDARRGLLVGDAVDGRIVMLTTRDGGSSWSRVAASALPPAQQGEGSFAASGTCVEAIAGGHAWVIMNGDGRARLLRTADYGRTWATETLPITARAGSGAQSVSFRDARHGVVFGGGYDAVAGDILVATTGDGGDTWQPREAPMFKVGSWAGAFVPGARTPTLVAAGPNGSAWARLEAGTLAWTPIDSANYWSLGFASPRVGWAVGTRGRVTKLSTGGQSPAP